MVTKKPTIIKRRLLTVNAAITRRIDLSPGVMNERISVTYVANMHTYFNISRNTSSNNKKDTTRVVKGQLQWKNHPTFLLDKKL